jgi:hypothetical protein
MGFLIQTTEIHLLKTSDIPSSDTFQIIPHSGNGQIIPIAQFIFDDVSGNGVANVNSSGLISAGDEGEMFIRIAWDQNN